MIFDRCPPIVSSGRTTDCAPGGTSSRAFTALLLIACGVRQVTVGGATYVNYLQHVRFYMEMKQQQLDDPATFELYRDLAVAIHWEADDPRVAAVADRLVGLLESAEAQGWETQDKEMTDELAELLDSVFLDCPSPIGSWTFSRRTAGGAGPSSNGSEQPRLELPGRVAAHESAPQNRRVITPPKTSTSGQESAPVEER